MIKRLKRVFLSRCKHKHKRCYISIKPRYKSDGSFHNRKGRMKKVYRVEMISKCTKCSLEETKNIGHSLSRSQIFNKFGITVKN